MAQCKAKSKQSGERCKKDAVPGFDVCHIHGGKSTGRPIVHGRYSKHLRERLQSKAAAFVDGDALDIFDELALQRALFVEYAERFEHGTKMSLMDIQALMSMLNDIMRSAERIQKMRNETALTGAEVALLQARAVDVAIKYFDDPNKRRQFIKDLFGLEGDTTSGAERLELVDGTRID